MRGGSWRGPERHRESRVVAVLAPSPWSGVPQDPQALVLLGQVDDAARIDEDVLALGDELLRQRAVALYRVGRQEPADLARLTRVCDVDDAQARVEVGEVYELVRALHVRVVMMLVLVVRSEAPALLAEIFVRHAGRRHGEREEREEGRLRRVCDVDERSVVEGLLAVLAERFRVHHGDLPARYRAGTVGQHKTHDGRAGR